MNMPRNHDLSHPDPERWRVSVHESGHAVACKRLQDRAPALSIKPTKRWRGVALDAIPSPSQRDVAEINANGGLLLADWPYHGRRQLEHALVIALAGPAAEELTDPPLSREGGYRRDWTVPPTTSDERCLLPALTSAEAASFAEGDSDEPPPKTDLDLAYTYAEILTDTSLASVLIGLHWQQVRQVVAALWRREILKLAEALAEHEQLSSSAVLEILAAP